MPFEISINDQTSFPVITLTDTDNGTTAEIYAFGAVLNKFSKLHQGEAINVIDGYESTADAQKHMTPFFKGSKLSPYVCRVKNARYEYEGLTHHFTKYFDGPNGLHGLIYDKIFSVITTEANNDGAVVNLQYVYSTTTEGYPYTYRCEVEYCLKTTSELKVTTSITNLDEQAIPIADGWHPYFKVGDCIDDCEFELKSTQMLEFDDKLIPTGRMVPYDEFHTLKTFGNKWYDNCFTADFDAGQPMVTLRNSSMGLQVTISPGQAYPFLQFFTPDHRKSIAIENLSAAPDAFNNGLGLQILDPGETAIFSTTYQISEV